LEQLLDAAERLQDSPALFVLIGDGMRKPALKEMARKRGLNNVIFIDPVNKEKVYEYIISADAGCSALKKVDTFKTIYSNKTFDYMGCQTPIIMAIDGISRELVETAEAGLYVEPENPIDFEEKVRFLMDNREEGKAMGKRGYAYARTHMHRTVLGEKYLSHLLGISRS
jgi:glycosyltransferase involved in cell wall biosynthesis